MGRPRKDQDKQEKITNLVFKRRKEGLKKKAKELSILCDLPVILMIRSLNGELEVWPPNPSQVKTILKKYLDSRNLVKNPAKRSDLENEEASNLANVTENVDVKGKGLSSDNREEQQMVCWYPLNKNNEEGNDMWNGIEYGFDESMLIPENYQNWGNGETIQGSTSQSLINNDHDSFFGWKQGLAPLGLNFDDVIQPQPPLQICYPGQRDLDIDNYLGNNTENDEKIDSFGISNPDFGFDFLTASTQSMIPQNFPVF